MIKNLKKEDEVEIFWRTKDDNSITASDSEVNANLNDPQAGTGKESKDFIVKNEVINTDEDEISSIELSINSGSMDNISKKNFIPKVDLIKNYEKNQTSNSIQNKLNGSYILNELDDVINFRFVY